MKPIIYTTPTCVYCHALMDWLDQKGILYEERNTLSLDPADEIAKKFGYEFETVPTTIIGDEVIVGFNRPAILRALKRDDKK
ncbi:glutaredoxin family protein [Candidatus Saccharibacteria bacterium]|nr:glutaredoxin family protein [Candidatus Saccharibacteria bacterium]